MSNYAAGAIPRDMSFPTTVIPEQKSKYGQVAARVIPQEREETDSKISQLLDYILPRNPVTHNRGLHLLPENWECAIGDYLYHGMIESQGGKTTKAHLTQQVEHIGKALCAHADRKLNYEFTVIDSSALNAWCLAGGKIGFYSGLLEHMANETDDFGLPPLEMEDKIAAVLAHEIVHAAARHTAFTIELAAFLFVVVNFGLSVFIDIQENEKLKAANQTANPDQEANSFSWTLLAARIAHFILAHCDGLIRNLVMMHESRGNEFEADRYGMLYMQRAGGDPRAAIWVQKFLAKQTEDRTGIEWLDYTIDLFRSHPHGEERIAACEQTLKDLQAGTLA